MKYMYMRYGVIFLHFGVCMCASNEAALPETALPHKIVITYKSKASAYKGKEGVAFVLKVPLHAVEPLTERTYSTLAKEAFKNGCFLGLINTVWAQKSEDQPLVSMTYELAAFLRYFGGLGFDLKDPFVAKELVRREVAAALKQATVRKKMTLVCYKLFCLRGDYKALDYDKTSDGCRIQLGGQLRKLRSRL